MFFVQSRNNGRVDSMTKRLFPDRIVLNTHSAWLKIRTNTTFHWKTFSSTTRTDLESFMSQLHLLHSFMRSLFLSAFSQRTPIAGWSHLTYGSRRSHRLATNRPWRCLQCSLQDHASNSAIVHPATPISIGKVSTTPDIEDGYPGLTSSAGSSGKLELRNRHPCRCNCRNAG